MKTTADAEANIGKVANDVWKVIYNLNKLILMRHKLKDGLKQPYGMDVEPRCKRKCWIYKILIMPGIKQAMAAKDPVLKLTFQTLDDAKDVKVKMDLLLQC